MSTEGTQAPGVPAAEPAVTASPAEQTVPIYRLNEEVQARRALEAQVQGMAQLLRQAIPPRQQMPEQDPPQLRELKERDPAAYQLFKQQQNQIRQQNAANFMVMDNQDRMAFEMKFGEEGKKLLPVIEQKLEELRKANNHSYNRGQIFYHLMGQQAVDALEKRNVRQAPSASPAPAPVAQAAVADVPASDVRSAGITAGSSASAGQVSESFEELEKRLENAEF